MSAVSSGTGGSSGTGPWKRPEEEYRQKEIASQKRSSWAQVIATVLTATATLIATFAVLQSRNAVHVAEQGIQRQTDETRLTTAVTAIGGTTPAERAAGIELLRRHVDERLTAATGTALNSWDRQDARGLYTSALIILSDYLPREQPGAKAPCAPRPLDEKYAADELQQLLAEKAQFMALKPGSNPPAVDLSYAELCDQYWQGVSFDGIPKGKAWLLGIDLRGSNLRTSQWGTATLTGAKLQCADLQGADLSHATLTGADLRGANLAGAQLPSTRGKAKLDGANWTPRESWDPGRCLTNGYGRS